MEVRQKGRLLKFVHFFKRCSVTIDVKQKV